MWDFFSFRFLGFGVRGQGIWVLGRSACMARVPAYGLQHLDLDGFKCVRFCNLTLRPRVQGMFCGATGGNSLGSLRLKGF